MVRKQAITPSTAIRCAIYSRKSTEEGLQQQFNSLDAQREAAEAFIKSQANECWVCLPELYAALTKRWPDARANRDDGLRLDWPDRWVHVRPSNTEPIVRVIAEAPTEALARELVERSRSYLSGQ